MAIAHRGRRGGGSREHDRGVRRRGRWDTATSKPTRTLPATASSWHSTMPAWTALRTGRARSPPCRSPRSRAPTRGTARERYARQRYDPGRKRRRTAVSAVSGRVGETGHISLCSWPERRSCAVACAVSGLSTRSARPAPWRCRAATRSPLPRRSPSRFACTSSRSESKLGHEVRSTWRRARASYPVLSSGSARHRWRGSWRCGLLPRPICRQLPRRWTPSALASS
jgi:hypothetical protein